MLQYEKQHLLEPYCKHSGNVFSGGTDDLGASEQENAVRPLLDRLDFAAVLVIEGDALVPAPAVQPSPVKCQSHADYHAGNNSQSYPCGSVRLYQRRGFHYWLFRRIIDPIY